MSKRGNYFHKKEKKALLGFEPGPPAKGRPTVSLFDAIKEGREFESMLEVRPANLDLGGEIRKAINGIQAVRKKPLICYMANVVNPNIKASTAIDNMDDLPFSELIETIPKEIKEIDIVLVTPGGSGQQVAKFIDKLRPRFEKVSFILPNMAMSAGTIFAMSGDEIIMDSRAYIGPIDPQILTKNGEFIPAQAIITLVEDIQKRGDELLKKGQNPPWTDLQILKQLDGRDIGNALNGSKYSIELVQNYLERYKFKSWVNHSDGTSVTDIEKKNRAKEIAELLCDHGLWKTHSRGINRNVAWDVCKIKIVAPETIPNLNSAIRKFWALVYWVFENTPVYKAFISDYYIIFRHELPNIKQN